MPSFPGFILPERYGWRKCQSFPFSGAISSVHPSSTQKQYVCTKSENDTFKNQNIRKEVSESQIEEHLQHTVTQYKVAEWIARSATHTLCSVSALKTIELCWTLLVSSFSQMAAIRRSSKKRRTDVPNHVQKPRQMSRVDHKSRRPCQRGRILPSRRQR